MTDFSFNIVLSGRNMIFNGRLTNAANAAGHDIEDDGTNWVGGDLIGNDGKEVSAVNLGTQAPGEDIEADPSEPAWTDINAEGFARIFGLMEVDEDGFEEWDDDAVKACMNQFAGQLRDAAQTAIAAL